MSSPLHVIQPSFSGGEFSPSLYARVDISKYLTGLKKARNVTVLPHGGVRNRAGTYMIAAAGDSTNPVRVIDFKRSTQQAYVLEFGEEYIRFFTDDAQILASSTVTTWVTATAYVVGNFVTNSSTKYYCLVAHTAGTFATDLAAGKWIAQTVYQIPSPYDADDIFDIKKVSAGDNLYLFHPDYPIQVLTRNADDDWEIADLDNENGPFMLSNVDTNATLSVAAPAWATSTAYSQGQYVTAGSLTPGDLVDNFSDGDATGWTDTEPADGSAVVGASHYILTQGAHAKSAYKALTNSKGSYSVKMGGSDATFAFSMSSTATGGLFTNFPSGQGYFLKWRNSTGTLTLYKVNGSTWTTLKTVSGIAAGEHFFSIYRDAAGVFTLYVDGTAQSGTVTDNTYTAGTHIFVVSGPNNLDPSPIYGTFTDIYYNSATGGAVNTTPPANYVCLIAHTSGTFATDLGNALWATSVIVGGNGVLVTSSIEQFASGHVGALYQMTQPIIAQSVSKAFTAVSQSSTSIQAGTTYNITTLGTWTGQVKIQTSIDNGFTWKDLAFFQSNSAPTNFTTSGETGYNQCLIRLASDTAPAWSGTATVMLSGESFDWIGIIEITTVSSTQGAVGNVLVPDGQSIGIGNVSATSDWAEGSWSDYRGFPACGSFYLDRLCAAGTLSEPSTVWMSKTGRYTDFGVSSPLVDSDAISVVLPSRDVNVVQNMLALTRLVCLTSDAEFSIGPGQSGVLSPTSVDPQCQGHRGSASIEPANIGSEMIVVQQMGTVLRNLIFQLAVEGYLGDDINIISRHLFTGYTLVEMAYQQEPDSIVWAVRSDGKLLSLTYLREQEVSAWTWHDSVGTFESVAMIPNPDRGFNEPWFVYKLGSVRYICRMMPRDMGDDPADQFFVDLGLSYDGSPATSITGLSHLNGQEVSILADGNVVRGKTVANGAITLDVAASVVHVGLPYVADIETLRIEAPDGKGTLQNRRVAIPRVTMRFWNSRGGYFGAEEPDDDGVSGLDEIKQREESDNWGAPIPLKTRDYLENVPGSYSQDAHIFYRQIDPLPVCLLAFIPQIVAGEN